MKNNGNFLLGLILIVVGALWIAGTMGLIELSMVYMLFRFWPVLLIVAGINILFKGNKGVLLLTLLLLMAGSIYVAQNMDRLPGFNTWHWNSDQKWGGKVERVDDYYTLDGIEKADLKLDLGAGNINIQSTDEDNFIYSVPDYNLSRKAVTTDEEATITFKHNEGFTPFGFNTEKDVTFDFHLPEEVVWYIDVNAGAADTNLDLSNLIVGRVDLDTGASDCQLTLGDKNDYTFIDIDTGVSDLELNVKTGVGLRVKSDQVISDNNFDAIGLKDVGDYHQTQGYDQADSQIDIEIDSAVSDIKIKFY